jgi:uracil-DNA glycosylase family 4
MSLRGYFDLGIGSAEPKTRQKQSHVSVETLQKMRCDACPLDRLEKSLKHPKMKATGAENPLIYIIGETGGAEEDLQGIQFVGPSGQLIRDLIPKKFESKIRWNNCLRCRTPLNRTPVWIEIECCRPFQIEDIERTKPKVIFGIGGVPLSWAVPDDGIYKWRGRYLPVKIGSHTCWFFPMLHPAGLLRQRRKSKSGRVVKSEAENTFIRDLKQAFRLAVSLPEARVIVPYGQLTPSEVRRGSKRVFKDVAYVVGGEQDLAKVLDWFKLCMDKPTIALDIETSSKERVKDRQTRPYGAGSKILSVALAFKGKSFAFPLRHKQAKWTSSQLAEVEKAFVLFLKRYKGVIVAHNLGFELEWLSYFYGKEIVYKSNWGDSMGQAYVLDERRGMMSLDILTLQYFGFRLKDLVKLNTANLDEEPIEDVLTYNALDSLYEHKLYLVQDKRLRAEGLLEVYQNHIPPILATTLTQHFGNRVDFDLVKSLGNKYLEDQARLLGLISRSKEIKKFERLINHKFNPASATDVIKLFRDILEREEGYVEDDAGRKKYSADDSVLKTIGIPLAGYIQEYRAALGHHSKYIEPLKEEGGECVFPDKRLHPNIHIFFTKSGRTSSSSPNQQFWPRDEPYRELRGEFVAEDDCWVVAIDQGQIEARVIGMASGDRKYCQYLWDRHDVHMDWTQRLAQAYPARIGGKKFLRDKDTMKQFRTDVKNQWTFPLFFGASDYSASKYLSIPIEVISPMVDAFWEEFSGVKTWQEELEAFYNRYGYVECLTGRRRRAPITHNELINSPIQGSASDITVSAMCRLSRAAFDLEMWQFQARMEIHDELVFHLPKKTFDRDLEFVIDHMLDCKHFPWINVPLAVEVKKGPDWYHLVDVGTFFSDDFGKINRKKCGF